MESTSDCSMTEIQYTQVHIYTYQTDIYILYKYTVFELFRFKEARKGIIKTLK